MTTTTAMVVVKAGKEKGSRVYSAGYFTHEAAMGGRLFWSPLMWDEEVEVTFDSFEEAERVVWTYNEGPGGDEVRAARWDSDKGEWVVTEWFDAPSRSGREDFHADG
jgi:hypothetical protein